MRRTWVLSLIILILPACLQRSQARLFNTKQTDLLCSNLDKLVPANNSACEDHAEANDSVNYPLRALSLEAKFSDIPIPLGSEPINEFFTQDLADGIDIVFGYTNAMDASKLYNFFKDESIRLGWSFCGGIQSIESLLTFEKPDRICTISLRPLDGTTAFIITMCPKDDGLNN